MEFQSHIVVTSQSMNKKIGAPTPSCFVSKQINAQPYYNNFGFLLDKVSLAGACTIKLFTAVIVAKLDCFPFQFTSTLV